ncbi:MAG: hypothetical protein WCL44_08870 [bacterium]
MTARAISGAIVLATAIVLSGVLVARAERIGPINVTVEPVPVGSGNHGYVEHRVIIDNPTATQRDFTLQFPPNGASGRGAYYLNAVVINRTYTVGSHSRVVVSLPQPFLPTYYSAGLFVNIRGVDSATIPTPYYNGTWAQPHFGSSTDYSLLISRTLNLSSLEHAMTNKLARFSAGPVTSGSATPRPRDFSRILARSETDIAGWSGNWLAYSQFDGIVLCAPDVASMPDNVKSAISAYVWAGGTLLVLGDCRLAELEIGKPDAAVESLTVYHPGMGTYMVSSVDGPDSVPQSAFAAIDTHWWAARLPWNSLNDEAAANGKFPVIETLRLPVRGMVILLLTFSLLIGPVNIFVLHRLKRKIWMLWTVPAISILTCLIVIIYSFTAEGITPRETSNIVTILDETRHTAVSFGMQAFYCPLTRGDGLHFAPDTEVTPMITDPGASAGNVKMMDWTRDQHLGAGWLQARTPVHLKVRKYERRRERLAVHALPDGTLSAVNGLGADITRLWLADAQGRIYDSGPAIVKAGAAITLQLIQPAQSAAGNTENVTRAFWAGWNVNQTAADLSGRLPELMMASTYLAVMNDSPFVEKPLTGRTKRVSSATVYGFFSSEAL